MSNDSIVKVVWVTMSVCLVCSIIVSTAAVMLRPIQEHNKLADKNKSILEVAGLYLPSDQPGGQPDDRAASVDELFQRVDTRIVDLDSGEFVDADPEQFFEQEMPLMPLTNKQDIAGIGHRAKYVKVYLLRDNDNLDKIILPVYGRGLWSTLYGFIALENNVHEVFGLKFYEHAETPGLGGEIDNPKWRRLWHGKLLYDDSDGGVGKVRLRVIKGKVQPTSPELKYEIDGLSGATLTSRGVDNMINFWFGELGYQKFLYKIKTGAIS